MYQRESIKCPADIRMVVRGVLDFLSEQTSLSEEHAYEIRLILTELAANSLLHGDGPGVDVLYRYAKNSFACCLMDHGLGFAGAGQCACPSWDQTGGRGIFLASAMATRLRYNKKGNTVFFTVDL